MGISTRIGADSLVTTLSSWVLSSTEMGSDGKTRASIGTPCATIVEAEAMASVIASAPSKKRFIGVPVVAGLYETTYK